MNMTLKMYEIQGMLEAINSIKDEKMPFSLTLILLRDKEKLENEFKFYTSRMNEIAQKYFEVDEKTYEYKKTEEGGYFIKEGMAEECNKAINDVYSFEVTVDLKKISTKLMENMDFSVRQIEALSKLFIDLDESSDDVEVK